MQETEGMRQENGSHVKTCWTICVKKATVKFWGMAVSGRGDAKPQLDAE